MKVVFLSTKGYSCFVDSTDYDRLMNHKWCLLRGGGNRNRLCAQANIKIGNRWRRILMHRFILGVFDKRKVDHVSGNGLDNRRKNLRIATQGQNQHNSGRRIYKGKRSSKYKGVHWSSSANKWLAQITKNRKHHYLGVFKDEEAAAREYDRAARKIHGEFAKTNF